MLQTLLEEVASIINIYLQVQRRIEVVVVQKLKDAIKLVDTQICCAAFTELKITRRRRIFKMSSLLYLWLRFDEIPKSLMF